MAISKLTSKLKNHFIQTRRNRLTMTVYRIGFDTVLYAGYPVIRIVDFEYTTWKERRSPIIGSL